MPLYPLDRLIRDLARTAHLGAMAWWLGAELSGGAVSFAPAAVLISGGALAGVQLHRAGPEALGHLSTWVVGVKLGLAFVAVIAPSLSLPALLVALLLGGPHQPRAGGGSSGRCVWRAGALREAR
jgi:hypothetical protein